MSSEITFIKSNFSNIIKFKKYLEIYELQESKNSFVVDRNIEM